MQFRNYEDADARFHEGLNMIVGRNGQGKTNLLEAIHVLCTLNSARAPTVSVLIRHGHNQAVIRAEAKIADRHVSLSAEVPKKGGVRLVVNGVPFNKKNASSGALTSVLFSPEDLSLIKGGPEQRRRFLDDAATRIRPLAVLERQDFEKVLRNRNAVLKAAQFNTRARSQLEVWTEQMIKTGAVVINNRLQILAKISAGVCERYRILAQKDAQLDLNYESSWAEEVIGESSVEDRLRAGLDKSQQRDLDRGISLVGPHRDDLAIILSGADARVYASQGEQRSLALALRLAERDLVKEVRGEEPILLLDDIFSELDDERRMQVAGLVRTSGQAIATSTSTEGVPLKGGRVLTVESGRLKDIA